MKGNLCKVEQINDSDNVALLIWYHYCDVRVNSNTTGATIEAGTDCPSGAHGYAPALFVCIFIHKKKIKQSDAILFSK
jgi:hypothetical protein